jgi:type IV secretory pathway TrbL component
MAQDNTPPREQRMDEALQNYRNSANSNSSAPATANDPRLKNPQPGPAARAEESMKRGAHRAGHAVRHGAHRTGEAIKHGAERTGDAIGRGVDKVKEKTTN